MSNKIIQTVEEVKLFGVKYLYNCFMEWLYGVRNKNCVFCKHFRHFHGSAGICDKKVGCLNMDMRDCFDTCDRKSFKAVAPFGR